MHNDGVISPLAKFHVFKNIQQKNFNLVFSFMISPGHLWHKWCQIITNTITYTNVSIDQQYSTCASKCIVPMDDGVLNHFQETLLINSKHNISNVVEMVICHSDIMWLCKVESEPTEHTLFYQNIIDWFYAK